MVIKQTVTAGKREEGILPCNVIIALILKEASRDHARRINGGHL